MERAEVALVRIRQPGVQEALIKTLGRDYRLLKFVHPKAAKVADVYVAVLAIKRVLGAVEGFAADLPEVIAGASRSQASGPTPTRPGSISRPTARRSRTSRERSRATPPARSSPPPTSRPASLGAPTELIERAAKFLEESSEDSGQLRTRSWSASWCSRRLTISTSSRSRAASSGCRTLPVRPRSGHVSF